MTYFCFVLEGELRHSPEMKPMGLAELLRKRYKWDADKAASFAQFLLPMLEYDPKRRATASQCLQHPWLTGSSGATPVQKDAQKEDAEVVEKETEMEVQQDEKKDLGEIERMDVAEDRLASIVDLEREGKDGETPGKDGDQHGKKEQKRGKKEEKREKEEENHGKEEEKHGKDGAEQQNCDGKDGAEQQNGDGKGRETTVEKEEMEGWRQKMTEERLGTDVEIPVKEGVR